MKAFKYHLGIDLHKKTSYWTLINSKREVLYRKNLPTSLAGIEEGMRGIAVAPEEVQAAVEPVSQWGWYGDLLEQKGFTVYLVDAYKTKLIAASKLKHDKVDARILAELMRAGFLPTAWRAPRAVRDLREFMRHRAFLVRTRSSIRHRVHQILWKHGIICPHADLFGKRALKWLQALALDGPYEKEREELIALWRCFSELVTEYDQRLKELTGRSPQAQLLMSIPGIGLVTSLTILSEVGTFDRFKRPEQLTSFAGLVSSSYSSGEQTRFGRITKRGSLWLRTAMVEATATVNPKWGRLYDFYRRIKEKKGAKVARVALARKMLTLSWYLVKNREFFRAQRQREAVSSYVSCPA